MLTIPVEKKADLLFEVSWEVCNKVGGIYTVVISKTRPTLEYYGDNYFLVGPYFADKVLGEFREKLPPAFLKKAFDRVIGEGIQCHFGEWLVPGNPSAILVDFSGYASQKDSVKKANWDEYRVDSLSTQYYDYDEPVVWATAVGRLLEEVMNTLGDKKVVAQFHEWMAGAGLLYLHMKKVRIATVFTTHATMLGRTLASSNVNLYSDLDKIEPDRSAYSHNLAAKHQTERQCAQHANVFTTVSEITGMEAERFFQRKPDILLLNGLDLSKFPTFEGSTIKHRLFRNRIREFFISYFFPYYTFNLEETLNYFICGRYEYRDKGIDVLIRALGLLNQKLKKDKSPKTIVCFFWIPKNIGPIKHELLESKSYYKDIKDSVEESMDDVKNRLICSVAAGKKISRKALFDKEVLDDLHKKVLKLKKSGSPFLATHVLYDEANDPILNDFRQNGLLNKKEDRVKVIFYPIYLTGADSLLDTDYYESMQGCHLGIFPSYYEPWGYTPLESAALGVPAVTTDLAGFGRWISSQINPKQPGIFVLNRFDKGDDEVTAQLAKLLYNYALFTKQQRVQAKIEAKRLAASADWNSFIEFYIRAHNLAVERSNTKN